MQEKQYGWLHPSILANSWSDGLSKQIQQLLSASLSSSFAVGDFAAGFLSKDKERHLFREHIIDGEGVAELS